MIRSIVAAVAALLVMGACSTDAETSSASSSTDAASSASISAVDNEFEPTALELTPGGEVTVEFTNNGESAHTFTSEELGFDTGIVDPGDTAGVTFTAPDEDTAFVCTLHEESDDMTGTIVVE